MSSDVQKKIDRGLEAFVKMGKRLAKGLGFCAMVFEADEDSEEDAPISFVTSADPAYIVEVLRELANKIEADISPKPEKERN